MPLHQLSSGELGKHLESLPGWQVENDKLTKRYEFPNFIRAIQFVNQVAQSAEAIQHHPDIIIRFNKVTISLTTHDAGGISHLDIESAAASDVTAADMGAAVPAKV